MKIGRATLELHVVGAGIGQGDAVLEQLELQVQVQERGRLERGKRPLVGEGDVPDPGMLQQVAHVRRRPEQIGVDLGAGDEPPLLGQALEQTLVADELVVGRGAPHDGAKDPLALDEDVPGWIAKGSRLGSAGDHC